MEGLVVQLTDYERLERNLRSLRNLLREVSQGPGDREIEIVFFQDAVRGLRRDSRLREVLEEVLREYPRARVLACEAAMRTHGVEKRDLIEGVSTVPSGIAWVWKRVSEGWRYICLP